MSFKDDWVSSRRLFILRLLEEVDGEANESVIFLGCSHGGFARDTEADICADLNHLIKQRCITEEWLNASLRVLRIEQRGTDAAYGRITVDGVQHSRWGGPGK